MARPQAPFGAGALPWLLGVALLAPLVWLELARDLRAAPRRALRIVFGAPAASALVVAAALAAGPATAAPAASLPPGARLLADQAYGPSARQQIDVYLPAEGTRPVGGSPILVMVHGGAWMFGDKTSRGVVGAKLEHWVAHGWIFVSVNNRLVPEADPLAQAEDVARALALVQSRAGVWGGDPRQLVLMGHSAGAHLVALLGASPAWATRLGVAPWAGTVVLDSAAIDLVTLMGKPHPRFYDRVFGTDPAGWPAASPTEQLRADATPMLLVCSTLRADDSCGQSERFAARLAAVGGRGRVLREALAHNRIDVDLGEPGTYTDDVDAFIASILPVRH